MYDWMKHCAECELVPRFQAEYEKCQVLKECPSYEEMQALCGTECSCALCWIYFCFSLLFRMRGEK